MKNDLTRSVISANRFSLLLVFMLSVVVNLLLLVAPIYMMQVFDRVLPTGNFDTLIVLTAMALLAILALGLFDEVRSRMLIGVGAWLERALRPKVATAQVSLASSHGVSSAQGLRDLGQMRQFFGGNALLPLIDAPWVPVFLFVVYLVHPVLGHISLAGAAVLIILAWLNERLGSGPETRANAASAAYYARAESATRNADVIRAMGMMGNLETHLHRGGETASEAFTASLVTNSALSAASKAFRLALQVAILGAGAWLVVRQEISAGGMIASSIIMARALAPVEQALGTWRQVVAVRGAAERLSALLRIARPARAATTRLPKPGGRLTVDRLSYQPPGQVQGGARPILEGIGFELPAGASLGIIGPSGAGKSTLVRLLVGALRPAQGTIRLDGGALEDWSDRGQDAWIGYVPQNPQLFDASVRQNIARLGEADDGSVVEAARRAGVHELVLQLPGAYEAEIGENGLALSGGQRQQIALARAMFAEPSLLVLDEPTASLDGDGEARVLKALDEARERGTTIILADHKPRLIERVDYILVLRNGRMAAFGPRESILGANAARAAQAASAGTFRGKPYPVASPGSPHAAVPHPQAATAHAVAGTAVAGAQAGVQATGTVVAGPVMKGTASAALAARESEQ